MPWVDTPRCGEAYQRRQIWEHERSLGEERHDGHARFLDSILADSSLLGGTLAVMTIAQLVLWSARWIRDDWHALLELLRMRAATVEG